MHCCVHLFYLQLDEKDDEITLHSQLAERLKQQMNEQVSFKGQCYNKIYVNFQ